MAVTDRNMYIILFLFGLIMLYCFDPNLVTFRRYNIIEVTENQFLTFWAVAQSENNIWSKINVHFLPVTATYA